jgi:hypothetical protein
MAMYIEDNYPPIRDTGLNTQEDITTTGAVSSASSSVTGAVTSRSGTATPAAASAVSALTFGSAGLTITWGTGAPSQTQPKGSLYIRTDGSSTSTRMYINTDGAGTWTNFTTAA